MVNLYTCFNANTFNFGGQSKHFKYKGMIQVIKLSSVKNFYNISMLEIRRYKDCAVIYFPWVMGFNSVHIDLLHSSTEIIFRFIISKRMKIIDATKWLNLSKLVNIGIILLCKILPENLSMTPESPLRN